MSEIRFSVLDQLDQLEEIVLEVHAVAYCEEYYWDNF